jgi:hypothetical protein
MEYRMHDAKWDNAEIPWIRASYINKKPYDIRAPVRPLYCENAGDTKLLRRFSGVLTIMFVNIVMYIALLYIAAVITYRLYMFI